MGLIAALSEQEVALVLLHIKSTADQEVQRLEGELQGNRGKTESERDCRWQCFPENRGN